MIKGEGGSATPPILDNVIWEQPLRANAGLCWEICMPFIILTSTTAPILELPTAALSTTSDYMNLTHSTAAHSCPQHHSWLYESYPLHSCPQLPSAPQLIICYLPTSQLPTAALSTTAEYINLTHTTAAQSCPQHHSWLNESYPHHSCPQLPSAPKLIIWILPTSQLPTAALSTTADYMNLSYTTAAHSCPQHHSWFYESYLHHSCPQLPSAPQLIICILPTSQLLTAAISTRAEYVWVFKHHSWPQLTNLPEYRNTNCWFSLHLISKWQLKRQHWKKYLLFPTAQFFKDHMILR